ncbi:MAG: hypothetical protein RL456_3574 [Pseudomonadota bacterium]|jgi:Tfp pilus assembly protein PilN
MARDLNLYDRTLVQRERLHALERTVLGVLAMLTLGVVAGTWLGSGAGRLQAETLVLQQQAAARRAAMAAPAADDPGLEPAVQALRERDAALQRLQAVIDGGRAGRREGYARHLEALARQSNDAVWITGLTLQDPGDRLELRGRMTDPARLPDYLRRLQDEPTFRGRTFEDVRIRPAGEDTGGTPAACCSEFTLRSHAAPGGARTGDPS